VAGTRPFILLVEDNPDDVELTLRVFRKHHVLNDVVVVNDGVQALDFLLCRNEYASRDTANLPQLILLDVNLPKLNGIEVLRELRQLDRTRTIPVVMLTTSKEQRDIVESYTGGANSYVRKPVSFEEFSEAIRQLGAYWFILNESP
jgi:two-component system response regulator